jgi:hypothetical protein
MFIFPDISLACLHTPTPLYLHNSKNLIAFLRTVIYWSRTGRQCATFNPAIGLFFRCSQELGLVGEDG